MIVDMGGLIYDNHASLIPLEVPQEALSDCHPSSYQPRPTRPNFVEQTGSPSDGLHNETQVKPFAGC